MTSEGLADEAAIAPVRAALTDAATRLAAVGARTEALAEYVAPRKVLLVPRPETLRPAGRVWRLGVLLLGADAALPPAPEPPVLYATGSLTRAQDSSRPTYVAASAERRRQLKLAAVRGHFAPGESVNFGARSIALDGSLVGASGPLTVIDGDAFVRWNPADPSAMTPFDAYLRERVGLLADPPQGA